MSFYGFDYGSQIINCELKLNFLIKILLLFLGSPGSLMIELFYRHVYFNEIQFETQLTMLKRNPLDIFGSPKKAWSSMASSFSQPQLLF